MIRWIKDWWTAAGVGRQIRRQGRRIRRLRRSAHRAVRILAKRERALESIREDLERDLDAAKRKQARYELALNEAQEKNEVLESVIQTQVASHRLLLARYEAETDLQVRLQQSSAGGRE